MQDLIGSINAGNQAVAFHKHVASLVGHAATNAGRSVARAATRSRDSSKPFEYHRSQLDRLASAFAVTADLGLVLGGRLKVAECLSGRYADILSNLYMGYAMLWYREKHAHVPDIDLVLDYAMTDTLNKIEEAFFGIFDNFPVRPIGWLMRGLTFPTGSCYGKASDKLVRKTSQLITNKTAVRDLLSESVFVSENKEDRIRQINDALPVCIQADKILARMRKEKRKEPTQGEREVIDKAEAMREEIIQVDAFLEIRNEHQELVMRTSPEATLSEAEADLEELRKAPKREMTFSADALDPDVLRRSLSVAGDECHNDPQSPRGKDTNSALGW